MRTESSKTAKANGFFAGLVVFLISLAVGSFCTAIQIYACSSILLTSLLFWINFVFVGVRKGRCFAVFMMMLYSIALEIVLLVLIGFFVFYTLQPKYGPFCGNCKVDGVMDRECTRHCGMSDLFGLYLNIFIAIIVEMSMTWLPGLRLQPGVLGNIIMVSVLGAFSVTNFFSLLFLKNFRIYLQAHQQRRSARNPRRRQVPTVSVIPTPPPYYPTLPADSAYLPPPPPYLECTMEEATSTSPPAYMEIVKNPLPESGESTGSNVSKKTDANSLSMKQTIPAKGKQDHATWSSAHS